MMNKTTRQLILGLALMMFVGGCSYLPQMNLSPDYLLLPDRPNAQVVESLSKLRYPADAQAVEKDLLVKREGTTLTIYNRTARSYKDIAIWLNKEYVNVVPELGIGTTTFGLRGFINQYGESFPVGHFLSPNKAFPVVLSEMIEIRPYKKGEKRVKMLLRTEIGKDIDRVGS